MDLKEIIIRSKEIRKQYHQLERTHHGSEWSIEEDALAFLTDAALVGRLAMSHQGRWPASDTQDNLKHKIGECIWWLVVLADRMDISLEEAVAQFLLDTHKGLSQE